MMTSIDWPARYAEVAEFQRLVREDRAKRNLRRRQIFGGAATTIRILGEVNPATAARVKAALVAAAGRPVVVEVDSQGGDVRAALDIWLALRRYGGEVLARISRAHSCAATIAMAGRTREMRQGGTIFVHLPHVLPSSLGERPNTDEIGHLFRDMDSLTNGIASIFSESCGGSLEAWLSRMRRETTFTASEAVAAGLVHRLVGGGVSVGANAEGLKGYALWIFWQRQAHDALCQRNAAISRARSA